MMVMVWTTLFISCAFMFMSFPSLHSWNTHTFLGKDNANIKLHISAFHLWNTTILCNIKMHQLDDKTKNWEFFNFVDLKNHFQNKVNFKIQKCALLSYYLHPSSKKPSTHNDEILKHIHIVIHLFLIYMHYFLSQENCRHILLIKTATYFCVQNTKI